MICAILTPNALTFTALRKQRTYAGTMAIATGTLIMLWTLWQLFMMPNPLAAIWLAIGIGQIIAGAQLR
jgi:hypothetical protein